MPVGKSVVVQPRGDVPLSLEHRWRERMPRHLARALAALVGGLEHEGRIPHQVRHEPPRAAMRVPGGLPGRGALDGDIGLGLGLEGVAVPAEPQDRPALRGRGAPASGSARRA